MQQKLFDMLLKEEELSWKTIIYDLVKSEEMDPWDVDITLLTQKYIEVIKKMQEHDLKISGKIVLAAAILLKIKCAHLIDKDITKLDALINQQDEFEDIDEEFFDSLGGNGERKEKQQYTLIPRNPQPRNRKVSINDLVNALQRAMQSKKRILEKIRPVEFTQHLEKKIDIMEIIRDVYHKIAYYLNKDQTEDVTFSRLLPPRARREDKVYTFLPLLHLENQKKIDMTQDEAFSEITVKMIGKNKNQ
ncbi:MAG: ScpA family protein [archaeon]|nr:ScpA family protein [archaeon]